MNKVLISIVTVLVISLGGVFMIKNMNTPKDNGNNNANTPKTVTKDDFKLTYEYKGDSKWSYNVKGSLPNPCYQITVDGLVLESYPEQIKVNVTVVKPPVEMVCAQVIQEYNQTFEVSASEGATFDLVVINK